jgi:hypothetical protein
MSMVELAKKYLDQIKVENVDFVIIDGSAVDCDAAELVLEIPRAMLREYSRIKSGTNKYPDPEEFWRETGLVNLLKGSGIRKNDVYLDDALEYLKGSEVFAEYARGGKINLPKSLTIQEKLPMEEP